MNISTQVARRNAPRQADAMRALVQNSCLALAALAITGCSESASAQVLPTDAKPLCSFETGEFPGWFATGAVTLNGAVKPRDSLNFTSPGDNHCHFYKWAEQMFLWLASPLPGGDRVFQSSDFYSVSAPDANGMRTLMPNTPRKSDLFVRGSKPVEAGGQPMRRLVLMAGNNSLVYYSTHVNEVYAFFVTGIKTGGMTPAPTRVPIERPELERISAFAQSRGISFRHPEALVLTVKSAWVETTGLDANKYITTTATIPRYAPDALNKKLTPNGTKEVQLALVGMHVVGSVKGHSEMVWATFEHIDNAPMATYSYINTGNGRTRVDPSPGRTWLFSARNCVPPFNEERMHARNAPVIEALDDKTIGPSDTCRQHAWGNDPGLAEKNTQVIVINSSVIAMLPMGDVRKNYLLVGATWGNGLGSNQLANTTLETFDRGRNCFSCHLGNLNDGKLSHMFLPLKPLLP